jgi:hypothetical protein
LNKAQFMSHPRLEYRLTVKNSPCVLSQRRRYGNRGAAEIANRPLSLPETQKRLTDSGESANSRSNERSLPDLVRDGRARELAGNFASRNPALRHQLNEARWKSPKRVAVGNIDRLLFVGLYRFSPKPAHSRDERCPLPWGAPRIHGELLKLGIDVGQITVAKYMAKRRRHLRKVGKPSFAITPTESHR